MFSKALHVALYMPLIPALGCTRPTSEQQAVSPAIRTTPESQPSSEVSNALMAAILDNDIECAKRLMTQLADINVAPGWPVSPLSLAAAWGRLEIATELLRRGADASHVNKMARGQTPLHDAARRGQLDLIRLLVSHNANVNAVTTDGFTPLMAGASSCNSRVAIMLLNSGANLEIKDREGKTAADIAHEHGCEDYARTIRSSKGTTKFRASGPT